MRDLSSHSEKSWTDAKNLKMRNTELTAEVQKGDVCHTVYYAKLKAVAEKVASVKAKLIASCVEVASPWWSAHDMAKGASKIEDDVSKSLMVVSGKVAHATKRKVTIIGLQSKNLLKRLLTQIEMKLQAAILCIRLELERDDSEALAKIAIR